MPRRASLFVCLGFAVALVFVTGISAGAEANGSIREKKDDVAAAQDRLMEIRMEASTAEASYNNALYEMNQLNGQIARTKDDLDAAKKRSAAAKAKLEERATQVYKSRNMAFMDVLVGVDNFSEFASRLNIWVRLLAQDRDDFVEVREARNDLVKHKDKLVAERQQRADTVERAVAQKKRADEAEAQAEDYLDSLNADLRDAIQAAQDRRAEKARTVAAAMVDTAPKHRSKPAPAPRPVPAPEPIPEVQASEVKQAPVPQSDLSSEQAAADREAAARASAAKAKRLAEQRAAERKAARKAAKQAAAEQAAAEREARLADAQAARQEARAEARRQAERAAERAAERQAARQKAKRQAERAAEQAAIEKAAAEQAAAERAAARRAAERREARRAEQAAAERKEARQEARAAEASASASASASAPASQGSRPGGSKGGRGDDASASASASASAGSSASASSSPAGGGGVSGAGGDVIAVAEQHLGTPYVLSPPGPCKAFEAEDCSCFTMLVFQEFGIALPDSPGAQMGYGIPVSGAPQAGDLLFWSEDGSGTITHVGIAMGDGTTIHASNYAGEVTITSINYVNGYVGARRLL